MKYLTIFTTLIFAAEMEVDGDLKVVGNVQVGTIDSLEQEIVSLKLIIAQLQAQIALLESQMSLVGSDFADCLGVVGGNAVIDDCGICDGNNESIDVCGDCGGGAISEDECPNYALSFDGVDDYVSIDNADYVGDMSVQVWFNPFEYSNNNSTNLFYQLESNSHANGRVINDRFIMSRDEVGTWHDIAYNATLNEYNHVVMVEEDNILRCFYNGELVDSMDMGGNFQGGYLSSYRIGGTEIYSGQYTKGLIYEVAIWNDGLTAAEIMALYNTGSGLDASTNSGDYTSSSNLHGYWNFNEGSGYILNDLSGNGNHGTIHGDPTWVVR